MDCFKNFDPLHGEDMDSPFIGNAYVIQDAQKLIKGLTLNNVLEIEFRLDELIPRGKDKLAESMRARLGPSFSEWPTELPDIYGISEICTFPEEL